MSEYGGGGSRTARLGIMAIGVVAVGTVLAILFKGGGGSGSGGSGPGNGTVSYPATQTMMPTQPTRPLRVSIEDSNYMVNGRAVDLAALTELASKVPPGPGAAVMITRSSTSRAKAENDLMQAMKDKGIPVTSD